MHIALREREWNALLVKRQLHIFNKIEVNTPIVSGIHPWTGGNIDAVITKVRDHNHWRRVFQKRLVGSDNWLEYAFGFEIGKELTTTRSETSLETNIVGNLAMKLAINMKHNSDVLPGKDKTDTESTVTVVYRF